MLVGLLAPLVGRRHPDRRHRARWVKHRTLLAFVIVCVAVIVRRRTSSATEAVPHTISPRWFRFSACCSTAIMMYKLGWDQLARLIIWLAIGM